MARHSMRMLIGGIVLVGGLAGLTVLPSLAVDDVFDTARVSVASNGTQGNGASHYAAVSADGSTIVYSSHASNLVDGDTNEAPDILVFDVATGAKTRVSISSAGAQANGHSYDPSVSADGSVIAYTSGASNLVSDDTNGAHDVFAFDVDTGTTTRVSVSSDGAQANDGSGSPAVSADGSTIAYASTASNLVAGDTNGSADVFIFDVATGTTTRVSVASDGSQSNSDSYEPAISADGSRIAYFSPGSNLVTADPVGILHVFAFDIDTVTTIRVSPTAAGSSADCIAIAPTISADGSTIAYSSDCSTLVGGDANGHTDVFVYEFATGTTTLASIARDGTQANSDSVAPAVSADGSRVAYSSHASNLVDGDTNEVGDVFIVELATGTTVRASVASGGTQGNQHSGYPTLTADGSVVVFQSEASNLTGADTNRAEDVFLTRVNRSPDPVGRFIDDDASIFESDIEWMAAVGITRGCNPPANDRFCPEGRASRGQVAAFLVRALGLTDQIDDPFIDDDDSIYEADIERLAAAGITRGCNPPQDDRFCPDTRVTRGQMAAFLVRAFRYADDGDGDLFMDDDGSVFEDDIDRLGASGAARGCDPPMNTRFCPEHNITRGQMAAFLHRALG